MTWRPRSASDFAHQMAALLPVGEVWPRDASSMLMREVSGLAGVVGRWAERCGNFLLIEAFPLSAQAMLQDWERVLGLPEPCYPVSLTLAERRLQVEEKLKRRPGAQSRAYFFEVAARLGYHEAGPSPSRLPLMLPGGVGRLKTITITEYRPAQCGITRCGQQRRVVGNTIIQGAGVGTPRIRFVWKVTAQAARHTWFACGAGGGRAGHDSHLTLRRSDDLECVLQKLKPGHTRLLFSYTGI